MNSDKVSIRRIIGDVAGNLGLKNVNQYIDDFARWSVEAENLIGTDNSYIHKECLLPVKNMKACLPDDLITLSALKYYDTEIEFSDKNFAMFDKGAANGGSVHLATIYASKLNNANTRQTNTATGNNYGVDNYSTSNNLVFTLKNRYVYVNNKDITEFGISYQGVAIDKEGFPLIAKSHELAVSHYLMWKCKSIEYYAGKIPHHVYKELESRWYYLCGQARGNDEMPCPAKLEYLANMFNQLLPLPNKKYF